jgi:hypothetical protein
MNPGRAASCKTAFALALVATCAMLAVGCTRYSTTPTSAGDADSIKSAKTTGDAESPDRLKADHLALGKAWKPAAFSVNLVTSNLVLRDKGLVSLAKIRESARVTSRETRRARLRVTAAQPTTAAGKMVRKMLIDSARHREKALTALQAWAVPKANSSARLRNKREAFDALWSKSAREARQATDVIQHARLAANMELGSEDLFR